MGNVHIVQHLCPQRHCIMGAIFVVGDRTFDDVVKMIKDMEYRITVHPWCGICGATGQNFEERETKYNTLDEAGPEIVLLQNANLEALRLISTAQRNN